MSKNEARRQKQLAKKKAKRDEKRSEQAKLTSDNPLIRLAPAEAWPIVATLVPDTLWSNGIGQLLIARQLPDGRLAIANFLVDTYCLGVKNAYWNIISEWEFDKLKRKLHRLGTLQPVAPEYFAKLLFDSVDYAQAIGFVPHPDYRYAKMLLAGVDAKQCTETFTFGKDGKPFYVNGPHDSPERIKVIMHKVNLAGGHFLVGMPPDEMAVLDESGDDGVDVDEPT